MHYMNLMAEVNLRKASSLKDVIKSRTEVAGCLSKLQEPVNWQLFQGEHTLKPRSCGDAIAVVCAPPAQRQLSSERSLKRPSRDEDFCLHTSFPLKRCRTDDEVFNSSFTDIDSNNSELDLSFLPVNDASPICSGNKRIASPLGFINQVDGTSDESELPLVKDKLPTDNELALNILPPSNSLPQRPTIPLFRPLGNAYGQSFQSGIVGTMIPGTYGMLPRNSYVPRFQANIGGSSRFQVTQSSVVRPGEIYGQQGNVLGFSMTAPLPLPSQQIYVPRNYGTQKHLGGMPWNFSENQNFGIPSSHPSYSRPVFWCQGSDGTVQKNPDHCSWPPYAAQEQPHQLHQPLRNAVGISHSPGRTHNVNTNQFAHSLSNHPLSDVCNDTPLSPRNISRPHSRKTPVSSSPAERLSNEVAPVGELAKNTVQQCVPVTSESESKLGNALTSMHFESHKKSNNLSEAVSVSRDSTSMSSSDSMQLQKKMNMAAPLISLSSMITVSDSPAFPVYAASPRISTVQPRYGGFENRLRPSSECQDPFYPIWPSQQQKIPSAALHQDERNFQPAPGYFPALGPRRPAWFPGMGGNCQPSQQYLPSSASGSVVLTDLLQQHSMMRQQGWVAEQQPRRFSSSSHSIGQMNEEAISASIKSKMEPLRSSLDQDVSRFAASSVMTVCGRLDAGVNSNSEISCKLMSPALEPRVGATNCRLDASVFCKADDKRLPDEGPVSCSSEIRDHVKIPVSSLAMTSLASKAGSINVSSSDFGVTVTSSSALLSPTLSSEIGRKFKRESLSACDISKERKSSEPLSLECGTAPRGDFHGSATSVSLSSLESQCQSLSRVKTSNADFMSKGYVSSPQHSALSTAQSVSSCGNFTDVQQTSDLKLRCTASPRQMRADVSAQYDERNIGSVNSQSYELWLMQRDSNLAEEIRSLELQVAQRRRTKKSLMAKQRTAQKSGRELSDDDVKRLSDAGDEQTRLQQQLYQCRKDARSHQSKVQEFRLKTMGHGYVDGQQLSMVEDIEEKPLERIQQFIYGNQMTRPLRYDMVDFGNRMSSSNEALPPRLNRDAPPQYYRSASNSHHFTDPSFQNPVHGQYCSADASRNQCFPIQDSTFKGDKSLNFASSNYLGAMRKSPSQSVESCPNPGLEDGIFGMSGRSRAVDCKQSLRNEFDVYGKVGTHEDGAFQNGTQHSHRDQLLMKSPGICGIKTNEDQQYSQSLRNAAPKELERFRNPEKRNPSSEMSDPVLSSGRNRACLAVDVQQLPGLHMSGYESKHNLGSVLPSPVKKPPKRLLFDGGKVPRKRMRKLLLDYPCQDEIMHHRDYDVELNRLLEKLPKFGTLSLTEPDIPTIKMTALPLPESPVGFDFAGGYGRLVLNNPDPYAAFDELCRRGEMNNSSMDPEKYRPRTTFPLPHKTSHSSNQVSVTVTLSRSAAGNVAGVVSAIADMLKVAVPDKFEIDPISSVPVYGKRNLAVMRRNSLYEEHAVNLQSLVRVRTKFCCHCSLPTEMTKLKMEDVLDHEKSTGDEDDRDVFFCSMHCHAEFNRLANQHGKSLRSSADFVNPATADKKSSPCRFSAATSLFGVKEDVAAVDRQKAKDRHVQDEDKLLSKEKATALKSRKWENISYKRWSAGMLKSRDKQKSSDPEDQNQTNSRLHSDNFCGIIVANDIPDMRRCAFCLENGDSDTNGPGRLLNMDFGLWVHVNCALWSSEVYETMDGTLMNVVAAYNRGQTLTCVVCGQKGATIACYRTRCINNYHLECARNGGVTFLENKTCYCRLHYPKTLPAMLLNSLSVCRKVTVDREENRQVANMLRLDDIENCRMRIGSLVVHSIGQLLPCQIQSGNFNTADHIYPVGFKSTRYYWSYQQVHSRCRYICEILEVDGKPNFVIKIKEPGTDDVIFTDFSCSGVWFQILKPFEQMRHSEVLTSFFTHYVCGEDLFGLTEPVIQRVIESLPGVEQLTKFKFRFGKSSMYVFPLAINPTGCIRSEPKTKTIFKRSHTLLSSFKVHSSSSGSALLGSGEFNIQQYMKQFTHTKPQRYRSLRTEWRNNVYLRRSNIQGLGLFAARQLEQYTMVIEYIGQLIRNELCEIREKIYEQQNRGIYMFRIDENTVIDATMAGGPARYINHSCDPNCFTEIIPTERGNKIVITALRKINSGEELTYDYKFDLEDDKKIPCLCGAAKCQKWMN